MRRRSRCHCIEQPLRNRGPRRATRQRRFPCPAHRSAGPRNRRGIAVIPPTRFADRTHRMALRNVAASQEARPHAKFTAMNTLLERCAFGQSKKSRMLCKQPERAPDIDSRELPPAFTTNSFSAWFRRHRRNSLALGGLRSLSGRSSRSPHNPSENYSAWLAKQKHKPRLVE